MDKPSFVIQDILIILFSVVALILLSFGVFTLFTAFHLFKTSYTVTDVLLLSILISISIFMVISKRLVDNWAIVATRSFKELHHELEYFVFAVYDKDMPNNPVIEIMNIGVVTELHNMGYKVSVPVTLRIEKGLTMLNQIGCELVGIQQRGNNNYYYIFKRPRKDKGLLI